MKRTLPRAPTSGAVQAWKTAGGILMRGVVVLGMLPLSGCYLYETVAIQATDARTQQPVKGVKVVLDYPKAPVPWVPLKPFPRTGHTNADGEVDLTCLGSPPRLRAWAKGYDHLELNPFIVPPGGDGRCRIELNPKLQPAEPLQWAGGWDKSPGLVLPPESGPVRHG